MKMVIIDDEYIVRVGIKETIDWAKYGIEIVGEATNGKAGLELIEKTHPDLVISDIKMPIMDGVEMVKSIYRDQLDLVVIILSGYKDFEFAKGALEHGAAAYLLKPIDNQELIDAVLKAMKSLKEKREISKRSAVLESEIPIIRKNLVTDIIAGNFDNSIHISEKMQFCGIEIPESGVVLCGFVDDDDTYVDPTTVFDALADAGNAFERAFKEQELVVFSEFREKEFLLFVQDPDTITHVEKIAKTALADYEQKHEEILSIGVSDPYLSLLSIPEAYKSAKANAKKKMFMAINSVTLPTMHSEFKPLVVKAMEFVAKNYQRSLTVKTVAEALFVSDSYLLHMFKDNTGKTFNEYLTDYRIVVAKKMLLNGTYKVYEVADLVGYSDEKYFSQIFKKKVGLTPSDYASQKGKQ